MILKAEGIGKSFGTNSVLRQVSFEMQPGTLCGIVGENGSGKSTLLRIIVGEWAADAGTIHIEGLLGYCPQQALLFPGLTVWENFRYFSSAYGLSAAHLEQSGEALMSHFNFARYRDERVSRLSGGTQQKLNLSIALVHEPKLLILDEPYSGFDWDTYLKFWDYAQLLRARGCAILVVSHLLSEQSRFDHIYKLENGCLL